MIWKEEKTMREILFRGKRLDNGKWVEGFLVRTTLGSTIIVNEVEEYSCGCCIGIGSANFEVDPSTVGQYTGLKDKKDKRIFDGDVIKRFWLGAEIIYCVRYDGEGAHFIGKAMNKSGFTTFDNDGEMFEVIGNIHDNPELLKGGEG